MFERAQVLLGPQWPACLAALLFASHAEIDAVLIGSVGAALRAAPTVEEDASRVDFLAAASHSLLRSRLRRAGGERLITQQASDGTTTREYWAIPGGAGQLTLQRPTDLSQAIELKQCSERVQTPGTTPGVLWLPSTAALRELASCSPWPPDNALVPGLDAVLHCAAGNNVPHYFADRAN